MQSEVVLGDIPAHDADPPPQFLVETRRPESRAAKRAPDAAHSVIGVLRTCQCVVCVAGLPQKAGQQKGTEEAGRAGQEYIGQRLVPCRLVDVVSYFQLSIGPHATHLISVLLLPELPEDASQRHNCLVRRRFELIEQRKKLSDSEPLEKLHVHLTCKIVLLEQLLDI